MSQVVSWQNALPAVIFRVIVALREVWVRKLINSKMRLREYP